MGVSTQLSKLCACVVFICLFCEPTRRSLGTHNVHGALKMNEAYNMQWRGGWGGKPVYVRIFVSIFKYTGDYAEKYWFAPPATLPLTTCHACNILYTIHGSIVC